MRWSSWSARKLWIAAGYLALFALFVWAGVWKGDRGFHFAALFWLVGVGVFAWEALSERYAHRNSRAWTSGELSREGDELRYAWRGERHWAFDLGELRLIGEHTTEDGPTADDWFWVFAVGEPVRWYEAPVYAEPGREDGLAELLGLDFEPGLANRTDLASRVAWPPELAGRPFLAYGDAPRAGFGGGLFDRLLPRIETRVAEEVRAFLDAPAETGSGGAKP